MSGKKERLQSNTKYVFNTKTRLVIVMLVMRTLIPEKQEVLCGGI
jgi:hypothetical protein